MTSSTNQHLWPYTLKVPNPLLPLGFHSLDIQQRAQLYDYNQRLQYAMRAYPNLHALGSYASHADSLRQMYLYRQDPRTSFLQEEPKPSHSYIGLIAMAILSNSDQKMVLSDIYQWILDHYTYFRTRGPGWRNSIRHNLSLNDCFIKSGRSANGKGHYWAIHPANIDDFKKGDFRRRRAQRRVRKYLGLSVPDDDDSPCPSPGAAHPTTWDANDIDSRAFDHQNATADTTADTPPVKVSSKRRLFDMDSLLAPDIKSIKSVDTDIQPSSSSPNQLAENNKEESEITSTDDLVNTTCFFDDTQSHKPSTIRLLQIPNLSFNSTSRLTPQAMSERYAAVLNNQFLSNPTLFAPPNYNSIFSRAAFFPSSTNDNVLSVNKWQEALTKLMNKSLEKSVRVDFQQ